MPVLAFAEQGLKLPHSMWTLPGPGSTASEFFTTGPWRSPNPDLLFILLCSALCSRRLTSRIISTSSTGFVFFPSFYLFIYFISPYFRKSTRVVPSRVTLRSPFHPSLCWRPPTSIIWKTQILSSPFHTPLHASDFRNHSFLLPLQA